MSDQVQAIVCPECGLIQGEARPEQVYAPRATHWKCWRCDYRFGVTLETGEVNVLNLTEQVVLNAARASNRAAARRMEQRLLDDMRSPMPDEGWERGRWFRVLSPEGLVWCETSDGREAVTHMRPGDTLYKQWRREETEWRLEPETNYEPYDWDEDG
jgi:Ni/Co efflux regulator RcnB